MYRQRAVMWRAPKLCAMFFALKLNNLETRRATASPAAANAEGGEGKKETCARSLGKLAIKIQHCMVMNTKSMVKGSH